MGTRFFFLSIYVSSYFIQPCLVLAQQDHAVIYFYRVNSLREAKSSEMEVYFNDKPAITVSIGARIAYKIFSQGRLKINAELNTTFRQNCTTTPIYLNIEPGQTYYVKVDGVSCINLERSVQDGERDLLKDYDFKFPLITKGENKDNPHMQIVKKDQTIVGPASIVNATTNLSSSGYENKYALIIGNSKYTDAPLRNPENDAKSITKELRDLGFKVLSYTNLNKDGMKKAIYDFEDKISKNKGIAVFFFAGHGLQSNGSNWLVPVDAKIEREYDIEDACLKADVVLRMLEINENPMNIIILDACRNNPYSSKTRSLSRGLAQPENAPKGSLVAFATAPGKTASDGDGDNGLYTQEFLKALAKPGLTVEQIFKEVRINVISKSNNQQIPWENSSLLGEFVFRPNKDN